VQEKNTVKLVGFLKYPEKKRKQKMREKDDFG
jgi:hypothetical protein